MDINKLLSSLSYFSVFFAPFLFPIVAYFVTESNEVKSHAKSAFVSHLLPFVSIILAIIIAFIDIFSGGVAFTTVFWPIVIIIIVNVGVVIWNIIRGIQVLIQ
ncbi:MULTISPECIES: DUF4870 domain-containing protein [Bacillaceae]|uniref:DUF4870 domain-containing protein n=1 Tax=Bacillaceae TaxID=186817 RepID=UPI001BDDD707|nr:DUF4870 domain-containing protein [Cytobacillus sp. IB215316]MDX8360615.1 DUF4870 domain-containing protein [Cytobacillus sp. IB215316]